MKLEITDCKGIKMIALSGEVDMYTSPELREEMMNLIRRRTSPLFVDFSGVSYIDSSGIATFVEGLKGIMSYNGKLKLVGIPDRIMEIFNFSKLDRVFEMYGSIDDALNSLNSF
ncbi:MAG: STAS domain-containing protein [Nitrospirota bacterium]